MGKQINFYMSEVIQNRFIEYLCHNHFIFLDKNSAIIDEPKSNNILGGYLYKHDYGNIIMRQDINDYMDSIKSPVIQFGKTIIKEEKHRILRGRLWVEDKYYDEEGKLLIKERELLKDYQMLVRWVKKNVPYQKIALDEYFTKEYVNDELIELQGKGFALMI